MGLKWVKKDGKKRNRMGWKGMDWNGVELSGMGRCEMIGKERNRKSYHAT